MRVINLGPPQHTWPEDNLEAIPQPPYLSGTRANSSCQFFSAGTIMSHCTQCLQSKQQPAGQTLDLPSCVSWGEAETRTPQLQVQCRYSAQQGSGAQVPIRTYLFVHFLLLSEHEIHHLES